MSTTAVINDPQTVATLPVKKENVNFAVVAKLDAQGKISEVRATSREKDITNLKSATYPKTEKEKADPEQIAFEQTVVKSTVGTLEGFEELIPDADVRLDIINIGLRAKFTSKVVTALTELDEAGNLAFTPVEPTYDATALLQAASERVVTSPQDKAIKMLSALSPEMQAAIIAQFQAIAAGQS